MLFDRNLHMHDSHPNAKSSSSDNKCRERDSLRRLIAERSLCGLANDTKWNEFISEMRSRDGWQPRFRYKCIDGDPSRWDGEWYYHLPLPMISVEWLDIGHLQETTIHRLPTRIETTDHSGWIIALLDQIGLDYEVGETMIRIFGYAPRCLTLFDE